MEGYKILPLEKLFFCQIESENISLFFICKVWEIAHMGLVTRKPDFVACKIKGLIRVFVIRLFESISKLSLYKTSIF